MSVAYLALAFACQALDRQTPHWTYKSGMVLSWVLAIIMGLPGAIENAGALMGWLS